MYVQRNTDAFRCFHPGICSDGHTILSKEVTRFVFAETPSHIVERYYYY